MDWVRRDESFRTPTRYNFFLRYLIWESHLDGQQVSGEHPSPSQWCSAETQVNAQLRAISWYQGRTESAFVCCLLMPTGPYLIASIGGEGGSARDRSGSRHVAATPMVPTLGTKHPSSVIDRGQSMRLDLKDARLSSIYYCSA